MVFTAKKVEMPGFGDHLKKLRESAGLSRQKTAQLLNIQVKFLDRLEGGELEKLPGEVYVKGFLRKYAGYLGIDPQALVDEYIKESKIAEHLNGKDVHSLPALRSRRFIFTPKHISLFLGALAVVLIIGYFVYQLNSLVSPPELEIFEPASDQAVESRDVQIKGKSEPGVKLTINGQETYIDKDGNFQQQIDLNQGLNSIKIEAVNRFGKASSVTRQIMVR